MFDSHYVLAGGNEQPLSDDFPPGLQMTKGSWNVIAHWPLEGNRAGRNRIGIYVCSYGL